MKYWDDIKHFKPEEFISPRDKYAQLIHGYAMDEKLIRILEAIRARLGRPMKINSGYRSPEYNQAIGGAVHSQHKLGKAADIAIKSQEEGEEIEKLAREYGIGGVGRYNTFIHLDTGPTRSWDLRK